MEFDSSDFVPICGSLNMVSVPVDDNCQMVVDDDIQQKSVLDFEDDVYGSCVALDDEFNDKDDGDVNVNFTGANDCDDTNVFGSKNGNFLFMFLYLAMGWILWILWFL